MPFSPVSLFFSFPRTSLVVLVRGASWYLTECVGESEYGVVERSLRTRVLVTTGIFVVGFP